MSGTMVPGEDKISFLGGKENEKSSIHIFKYGLQLLFDQFLAFVLVEKHHEHDPEKTFKGLIRRLL